MPGWRKQAVYAGMLFLFWLLLSPAVDLATLAIGALATMLTMRFLWTPLEGDRHLPDLDRALLRRLSAAARFVPIFLWSALSSAANVARYAFAPRQSFTPGLVVFRSQLGGRFALVMLANAITLTPGTLTVDIADNGSDLLIHCLHVDEAAIQAELRRTEAWIARIFD